MGWLGKLFGGGAASIASLRKAVEQKRFADARLLAEQLLEQGVAEAERTELQELQLQAGDGLARLNLEEAFGFQRTGDLSRAQEHLELARELAGSQELCREIDQLLSSEPDEGRAVPEKPAAGHSGCGGCAPGALVGPESSQQEHLDLETQLDLVLTAFPDEIVERYRSKGDVFLQAFLLSNGGDDEAALSLWSQVPSEEQDALYCFEYGSALARAGKPAEARPALAKAVQLEPNLLLASEALIPVLVSLGETDAAFKHLQELLDRGQDPAFCHAHLAMLNLQLKNIDQALIHIREAVSLGVADGQFLQLAASLLERSGSTKEAEAVLQRLPGRGCGGGISLPLAEFLLRQKRDLDKVLDSFNAACRQNPDSPRWQLRVAQTYLARNWRKEGTELLQKVVEDPRLEPELQLEAKSLLAAQKS